MATVTFNCVVSPRKANAKFRQAVKAIRPLKDSFLGKTPKVVPSHFDPERHIEMRQFSDKRALEDFVFYLRYELIEYTPDPHPFLASEGTTLIYYQTTSAKSAIGIVERNDGNWLIFGWVDTPSKSAQGVIFGLRKAGITSIRQFSDNRAIQN